MRCKKIVLLVTWAVAIAAPTQAADFVVRPVTIPEMKAVFGEVASRTVVPARARIGGTIRRIGVTEGSEVREGDVIGLVVDDKIALQLAAADAKINALRSQLENARTEVQRTQELLARGVATQSRLDTARTTFEVATNQVAAAVAEKAVIEQGANEGDVLAPASGRVLTVPVTPGSVIFAGEVVARIATGPYYLRLSLPERHASEIETGASVAVAQRGRVPSVAYSIPTRMGKIAKVYPEIADGRVVADVEIADIGNYFVNERILVSIRVGKRSALAVPSDAVSNMHGVDYVRVSTANGPMDLTVIVGETFAVNGRQLVEILTGLRDGDRVVLP